MKIWKRPLALLLAVTTMTGLMVMPSYAASRKKIKSVSVTVESNIQPETEYGDEEVDVNVRGGHCSFDYYDIENDGFEWQPEDVPEITIYLRADEGYYFSLTKASSVKLSGATYVKATKQDSSETLALKVKLPSLAESVGEVTNIVLTDGGYAYWDEPHGAGSYELRLYRNGSGVGASYLSSDAAQYNFQTMMGKPGYYTLKVRAVNKIKPDNKGVWGESNSVTINSEKAEAIRNGETELVLPVSGEWIHDGIGWWYKHSDDTYTRNNWELIEEKWYFFDEDGYMKTGWVEWDGEEYYFKEGTGELLTNTTTPDGYILDYSGKRRTD